MQVVRGNGAGHMKTKDKYDYIDTLRFLAICFIIFAHFDGECFQYFMGSTLSQLYFTKDSATGWLLYGWNGKYALALLCVISGFLSAMKCSRGDYDTGEFVITRYLRLMLPVMGANLIFGIWLTVLGEKIDVAMYLKSSLTPGLTGTNRNLWCIGSFLIGNILICLLGKVRNRSGMGIWLYFPLLAVLLLLQDPWLFAVVLGGFTYEFAQWLKEKQIVNHWWLLGIIPLVWWLPRGEESTVMYYRDILAAAIIMIAFHCLPVLQRIMNWKGLCKIKQFSYSLFIVHGMTLFLLGPTWGVVQKLGIYSFYGVFVSLFLMTFAIDLVIAIVLYYLFEVNAYKMLVKWLLPKSRQEEQEAAGRVA